MQKHDTRKRTNHHRGEKIRQERVSSGENADLRNMKVSATEMPRVIFEKVSFSVTILDLQPQHVRWWHGLQ